jgi:hypothetical protein
MGFSFSAPALLTKSVESGFKSSYTDTHKKTASTLKKKQDKISVRSY